MMPYIKPMNRDQYMMCSFDQLVDPESIARLIDAFVESLDLEKLGTTKAKPAFEGRPSYDPRDLYKLYIYGNRKGIRSSRKLQEACRVNLEVKWMMGGAEPDFRTISDFRKDNISTMKKVFYEFNSRLSGKVEWGFSSIDGTKIAACNSKENNFTKNKLDDRIKWLNAHTDEYLRQIAEIDEAEDEEDDLTSGSLSKEELEKKLAEAQERLARYLEYQKQMEETGASQLSLTDADAKLMKNKNGFIVGYNPQTAVDSNTHLIRDYQLTNQVTDHGMMNTTIDHIRQEETGQIIETVADKGYDDEKDMIKCLEKGIIPHVILSDGKDDYELSVEYHESEVNDESTDPEDISRCLHSGKIPAAYKDVISDMKVIEKRRAVPQNDGSENPSRSRYGTPEEMLEKAKEGYFVRDPERNLVYCPAGEILRQKCIKPNGNIRYANKNACKHCKYRNKCYSGKNDWKEIDFNKDTLEKPCRDWLRAEGRENDIEKNPAKAKRIYEMVKYVVFKLKPDRKKMEQRMCLSEHPFGTVKRSMGADHFLLRGRRKVDGECALFFLGYNFERAKNLLGFESMMKLMSLM